MDTDGECLRDSVEFWSSVELGTFMSGLIRQLRSHSVPAVHHFAISERAYRSHRSKFGRLLLRWRMYCGYPAFLASHSLYHGRVAARVVCSNTFYAPLVAAESNLFRDTKLIHLVYDLFPDVLFHAGVLRAESACARVLERIARASFRVAHANVFLGRRLMQHVERRFGRIQNPRVIPVGADAEPFKNAPPSCAPQRRTRNMLYCGNMGAMHDTQTLLQFFRSCSDHLDGRLQFRFCGSGSGFSKLRQALEQIPGIAGIVRFEPFLSAAEWETAMKSSEIALVTMIRGAEDVLMPSKTYSAMVAGQAVLAICSRQSDLAELILGGNCGWVVEPGDVAGLRETIRRISTNSEEVTSCRTNSYRLGHQCYSTEAVARLWIELLEDVNPPR
jgi:glycosyltransferase involved in cell wall biosynthesis